MLIWSISYPVCLPWRWKWEEINIGLSHHLLVHHSKVQLPAEDFDYFPRLWQTRSGLRSLSLLSTFFFSILSLIFFTPSPAVCVFPASFCVFFFFFNSPETACCDHFLSHIDSASNTPTFTFPARRNETDVNDPGVRGRGELVAIAHPCAGECVCGHIYYFNFQKISWHTEKDLYTPLY